MPRKQAVFVIKDDDKYWSFGRRWTSDINEAIAYFSLKNAEEKGPGNGKIIAAVIESTIREVAS